LFHRGLATSAISVVAPIAGAGSPIPVVVVFAGGDRPSPLQEIGLVCGIGGAAGPSWDGGGRSLGQGVGYAPQALFAFGGYFVVLHRLGSQDYLWAAFLYIRPQDVGLRTNQLGSP
jgi:hypothetical protein